MTKGIKVVGLALATAAVSGGAGAVPALAEDPGARPAVEAPASRIDASVVVVNNHLYAVTVVAVDASGVQYRLGTLDRAGAEEFSIPESVIDWEGGALIKVYPIAPIPGLGHSLESPDGIKTRIRVSDESRAVFWLEPNLTRSFVQEFAGQ